MAATFGLSTGSPVESLSELHALGIDLFLHQQGLDTTTPAGKAMFQMLGVFAEFEHSIIQERVRAGLQRAKREGKRLARPPTGSAHQSGSGGRHECAQDGGQVRRKPEHRTAHCPPFRRKRRRRGVGK